MDRRQVKTKKAIFDAFDRLISVKRYEKITIKDIIDEADIGRSTFYAHFESKDALLETMCADMFEHIFSDELKHEKFHDYSNGNYSLSQKIEHIFRHLYENREEMTRILSCESSSIFIRYFSEYFAKFFKENSNCPYDDIPESFYISQLTDSLVSAVYWWAKEKMRTRPEKISEYYCTMNIKKDESFSRLKI